MARNAWAELDPDVEAMRSSMRPKGSSRWGRVVFALVVIASLTFVGAFYVPLVRAHEGLTAEQHKAADRVQAAEHKLAEARSELKSSAAKLETLEVERRATESSKSSGDQRLAGLKSKLVAALEKPSKKGLAALAVRDGRLRVALADALIFAPRKLDVSTQGRTLLCEIAKQAGAAELRVTGFDGGQRPTPPLSQKYPSAWVLRSARAASVAQVLEDKCGVAANRLSALAGSTPSSAGLDAKLPAQHVEVELSLGAAPR